MTSYLLSIEKQEEFWSLADKSGGRDSCWPWQGSILVSGGYGRFRAIRGAERLRAHRIALCLETGLDYENPLVVIHACDNPPCVNPDHLSWGTQKDNLLDAKRKGRMTNGGNTWTRRLSDEEILGIADAVARGFSRLEVSRMFNCSKVYVEGITSGRSKRANILFDVD